MPPCCASAEQANPGTKRWCVQYSDTQPCCGVTAGSGRSFTAYVFSKAGYAQLHAQRDPLSHIAAVQPVSPQPLQAQPLKAQRLVAESPSPIADDQPPGFLSPVTLPSPVSLLDAKAAVRGALSGGGKQAAGTRVCSISLQAHCGAAPVTRAVAADQQEAVRSPGVGSGTTQGGLKALLGVSRSAMPP